MGAEYAAYSGNPKGYTAQILPNLERNYWSSSVHPYNTDYAYYFNGRDGDVDYGTRSNGSYVSVRCVVRAAGVVR